MPCDFNRHLKGKWALKKKTSPCDARAGKGIVFAAQDGGRVRASFFGPSRISFSPPTPWIVLISFLESMLYTGNVIGFNSPRIYKLITPSLRVLMSTYIYHNPAVLCPYTSREYRKYHKSRENAFRLLLESIHIRDLPTGSSRGVQIALSTWVKSTTHSANLVLARDRSRQLDDFLCVAYTSSRVTHYYPTDVFRSLKCVFCATNL